MATESSNKVVLDTNMLLVPIQFKVDVYDEIKKMLPKHDLCVLTSSLKELEKITQDSLKKKKERELALEIMEKNNVEKIPSEGYVDEELIRRGKNGAVIATNDKELKQKLIKENVKVIILKEKRFLQLV